MKQSVLAVIQVASSVAMAAGLDEAMEVREAMLDDPARFRSPPGNSPGIYGNGAAAGLTSLPDISQCNVNVRALRDKFDNGVQNRSDVVEQMEICTRL